MPEEPGRYDAVLGGDAAPYRHKPKTVTRFVTGTIRVEGESTVDVDEIVDAIAASPAVEIVSVSKVYHNRRGAGVRRYLNIKTVPRTF